MHPDKITDASEVSDAELVQRSARGDATSFELLVERHALRLLRLASALLGRGASSRTDAEDVVQETFIGALRGLSSFRHEASPKTWLTQILARQVALWRRKRRHDSRVLPLTAEGQAPADGIEKAAGRNMPAARDGGFGDSAVDARLDIQSVLAALSPEHRQVLELREWHGLSYEEIATLLELPRGTVESRIYRARTELRRRLPDYESERRSDEPRS